MTPTVAVRSPDMEHVDGYLSRKAQGLWPDALVIRIDRPEDREQWVLRRKGQEDVGLGESFHDARGALLALLRAERRS